MNRSIVASNVQLIRLDNISSLVFNLRVDSTATEDFDGLCSSIKRRGLLQPIIVRKVQALGGQRSESTVSKFEVICGHRRYQACKWLGLRSIPCIITEMDDQTALEIALTENIQREDFNPIEEAEGFKLYVSLYGRGSAARLARKIGKSEEYVSHRLLLLCLPDSLKDRICRRLLKASEATELVWMKDPSMQIGLANEIIKKSMTFREVRRAVKLVREGGLSVSEAVDMVSGLTSTVVSEGENDRRLRPSPGWMRDQIDLNRSSNKESRLNVMNRIILMVRNCLSGLDMIHNQVSDSELRQRILHQRQRIHAILDDVIKEKISYQRALTYMREEKNQTVR